MENKENKNIKTVNLDRPVYCIKRVGKYDYTVVDTFDYFDACKIFINFVTDVIAIPLRYDIVLSVTEINGKNIILKTYQCY